MSRIPAFEKFVADRPDDPFARYALALEYKSAGRPDDAVACFRELARRRPDYVPTYLQLGTLLRSLQRPDEARQALRAGIAAAEKAHDSHALGELQESLAQLG